MSCAGSGVKGIIVLLLRGNVRKEEFDNVEESALSRRFEKQVPFLFRINFEKAFAEA
jgi:hypothetical protein